MINEAILTFKPTYTVLEGLDVSDAWAFPSALCVIKRPGSS